MSRPADMAASVGAPHYRNTQFRKWSYLGTGCWLRTFLSLIWLCIGVVRAGGWGEFGGMGVGVVIILPPEIHFLFLAMSRSTKRLLLTPLASILTHWPHLGRTNSPLHTDRHTPAAPQLHASRADSSTMSSIWFSFTPENQNNPRRRRSWQRRRFTECERMRATKWDYFSLGVQLESETHHFLTPYTLGGPRSKPLHTSWNNTQSASQVKGTQ